MSGREQAHSDGWEWARIQREPCPQCHQHPAALPPGTLGVLAVASAHAWRSFLSRADDTYLRCSRAPGIWSPIQYGAHVRDMLRVFGDRILTAVAEDDPSVPWFDPGPDGWAGYNRLGRRELVDDLEREALRFQRTVIERDAWEWSRVALRDGVDRFTVQGLACFGAHEAHHHLLDAAGML